MTFGRCVRAVRGDKYSPISPRWTTRVFVFGDIFSFLIQSSGAGLLVKGGNPTMGENIIVGGLIFQVVIFAVFIYVALHFNLRFRAHGATTQASEVPWQACLIMLYTTSLAIMVRNVFRVVEYAMGNEGYLLANEWPVYVFDGSLMFLTMAGFFYWYPSQLRSVEQTSMAELTDPEDSGYGQSERKP
ncbi:RTA1 like protein [Thozetella sp. PMI_491]|nr:RTA1 like protein [Thozetella sp. PMI_491]